MTFPRGTDPSLEWYSELVTLPPQTEPVIATNSARFQPGEPSQVGKNSPFRDAVMQFLVEPESALEARRSIGRSVIDKESDKAMDHLAQPICCMCWRGTDCPQHSPESEGESQFAGRGTDLRLGDSRFDNPARTCIHGAIRIQHNPHSRA